VKFVGDDNLSILAIDDYDRILRGMNDRKGQKRKGARGVCNKDANQSFVQPLKRHITQERKQLERLIYGLRTKLYLDVERSINVILEKIRETEHSVELIAQELSHRDGHDEPNLR
jgi:hypothetical protein